jgi:hypothetical protein
MNGDARATHDRGADLAAYALDALDPVEASELTRHVRNCEHCRAELTALERVADALAMGADQFPAPARLRRRVLRDIRADARRAPRPEPRRWPRLGYPNRALMAAALVVLVLVLAGVGVAVLAPNPSIGSRTISAEVANPASSAEVRIADGRGRLIVHNMPPPPAGRIYEVWLKHGSSTPSPTQALFSVTADGSADVDVPGDLSHVGEVLVTQEPAGGSRVSTHRPLIVARLT